jgi:ribosomal protein L37AE/L43A
MALNPSCQSCRREAGIKQVLSANGKKRIWKCQSCIDRKSVSFLLVKHRSIHR